MTLSTKILLSYLALGGGVGGIYIGVNGGIGNKEIEKVADPVNTPDVVEPEIKDAKTEEHAEDKDKGVGTEETLEVKNNEETKESATSDDATRQTKITDNSEGIRQDTDLELQDFEVVPVPNVEIQVTQTVPEIKYQRLQIETNPPTPKETKENAVPIPIEAPVSNQITPKTEEALVGTSNSAGGEGYGMTWIVDLATDYANQRQAIATAIKTIRQSLS